MLLVAFISVGLLAAIVVAVVGRYVVKGPELDRGLPTVSVADSYFQVVNIDSSTAESLAHFAIAHRRELPSPTGLVEGASSDLDSVRMLSPEEARHLTVEVPQHKIKPPPKEDNTALAQEESSTGTGEDMFFHNSNVEGSGYDSLQEGQRVSYNEGRGPKGPRAENVRPI